MALFRMTFNGELIQEMISINQVKKKDRHHFFFMNSVNPSVIFDCSVGFFFCFIFFQNKTHYFALSQFLFQQASLVSELT